MQIQGLKLSFSGVRGLGDRTLEKNFSGDSKVIKILKEAKEGLEQIAGENQISVTQIKDDVQISITHPKQVDDKKINKYNQIFVTLRTLINPKSNSFSAGRILEITENLADKFERVVKITGKPSYN